MSKIESITEMCTISVVKVRAMMRYDVERSRAAAVTKRRRYTVCLDSRSSVPNPILNRTAAYLSNVTDVPVLSLPRPPPSPPWDIQVERANADTTQNPAN